MAINTEPFAQGRCACGEITFRLRDAPYVVHCCHCTDCQRETGSAFVVNAVIETDCLELTGGRPESVPVASASGQGQEIMRCPSCKVAVWSHYGAVGTKAAFVRTGTLHDPASCQPDVHVFIRSKQPWVVVPEGIEAFATFYSGRDIPRVYGEEGAARFAKLRDRA